MTDAQLLALLAALIYKRWDGPEADAEEALDRAGWLLEKAKESF